MGANKERIADAPVLIVSTFEKGKSGFFQGNQSNEVGDGWGAYDNGLSNCYLIPKARAMGFDTLIMGMRDADALRQLFNIPENETIMAVISLGYRDGEPTRPGRRPLFFDLSNLSLRQHITSTPYVPRSAHPYWSRSQCSFRPAAPSC